MVFHELRTVLSPVTNLTLPANETDNVTDSTHELGLCSFSQILLYKLFIFNLCTVTVISGIPSKLSILKTITQSNIEYNKDRNWPNNIMTIALPTHVCVSCRLIKIITLVSNVTICCVIDRLKYSDVSPDHCLRLHLEDDQPGGGQPAHQRPVPHPGHGRQDRGGRQGGGSSGPQLRLRRGRPLPVQQIHAGVGQPEVPGLADAGVRGAAGAVRADVGVRGADVHRAVGRPHRHPRLHPHLRLGLLHARQHQRESAAVVGNLNNAALCCRLWTALTTPKGKIFTFHRQQIRTILIHLLSL